MSDKPDVESTRTSPVPKEWVQFEENAESLPATISMPPNSSLENTTSYSGAVLDTQSVSVDVEKVKQNAQTIIKNEAAIASNLGAANQNTAMRNVNLEEESANGSLAVVLHGEPRIHRGFGKTLLIHCYMTKDLTFHRCCLVFQQTEI